MAEPYNYIVPAAQQDPFASVAKGFGIGQQLAAQRMEMDQKQQLFQQQQAQQQQYQQDVSNLLANPNPTEKDFATLQLKYPQLQAGLKEPLNALSEAQRQNKISTASRVASAYQAGRPDLALGIVSDQLKALENSNANPQEVNALRGTRDLLQSLPVDQAKNASLMYLSTLDPKGFATTFSTLGQESRAQQEQPYKTQKLSAEAQTALPKAQADIDNIRSQIAERAAKIGLDRDTFNLNFDKTLAELKQKGGVTLSPGMEKTQADSVGAATVAQQASDDAAQLADQFRNANVGRGAFSTLGEYAAKVTGNQDAVTQLRKRYIQIKNQAALSMLPPGPASDKDIQTVQAGFLPETADGKQIADWLTSFSNVQKAVALRENAKADWISAVGNAGTAKQDVEVSGIQVPAGTSFNDFLRRGLKPQNITNPQNPQAQPAQPAAQPRYMDPANWGRSTTTVNNTQFPSGVPG